jgi:hypothetical protein
LEVLVLSYTLACFHLSLPFQLLLKFATTFLRVKTKKKKAILSALYYMSYICMYVFTATEQLLKAILLGS